MTEAEYNEGQHVGLVEHDVEAASSSMMDHPVLHSSSHLDPRPDHIGHICPLCQLLLMRGLGGTRTPHLRTVSLTTDASLSPRQTSQNLRGGGVAGLPGSLMELADRLAPLEINKRPGGTLTSRGGGGQF